MTSKIRCLPLLLLLTAAPLAAQQPSKKLIILGFDGVDAKLTQQWMDEGKLPNLAKLRAQGTFTPLRPTIPSQTPVSWSTFSTGLNPGRHGVFDFLKRDPATYRPDFAAAHLGREPFLWGTSNPWLLGTIAALVVALLFLLILKLFRLRWAVAAAAAVVLGIAAGVGAGLAADRLLPESRPIAISNQHGDTFWKLLGAAGKRVIVMRIPVTFPPKAFEQGKLLSGLGVPDVSGRIGKPFYFTSELFFTPKGGGDFSLEVVELVDNRGTIETEIKGPPNELFPEEKGRDYIKIPMTLTVAENRSTVRIQVSGNDLTLKPGQWSDWAHFTFPFNSLIKLKGIGKFKLLSIDPEVRLYLSPIEFDPENLPPGFDITTPPGFVDELTHEHGLFKTKGWMIDTWSLTNGTADEQTFLDDVKMTVDKEKEILDGLLAKDEWDVLVHYFEFPDRVQHMMFRFFDPKHPLYTAEGAAKWGGSILASYQEMDRIVGETMKKRPEAALMVLSDHGFASFRRGMNYNTWLAKNGFMTLTGEDAKRKNLEDLFDQGDFFTNVDWSKTKAYALGLGQIYINLKGREQKGIVKPGAEYQQVTAAIKAGLEAFVDDATGEHPVAHVFTRDEAYNGVYDPVLIPDLIPSNSEGYRVGWQDSLGGIAKTVVEPNTEIWSGDHCSVYPPLVQGILFSSIKLNAPAGAYMGDVMPTILDLYKVKSTTNLDGKSLLVK
ncbi:MAG TPA: alkaline phosphatase family protein [Thermoanaerobaculia bacterium]|jgi:predicted AlkP superfamily phosphohydrolase/phosphomutase|nr:alkaline phosphatase family protein [Thermoanaerobaculia bacterium]